LVMPAIITPIFLSNTENKISSLEYFY